MRNGADRRAATTPAGCGRRAPRRAAIGALAVALAWQRGERVHAAMLARGYDGRMPATGLEAER